MSQLRHRRAHPTEVYVPRIRYPHGYRIKVRGAQPVSKPDARILKLQRGPSRGKVRLRILPKGGSKAVGG